MQKKQIINNLNKEFMNDKFFAHTIKDETELYLVSCASVIALEYVESVTDRGLSQTSMHDMYNTIKKEFGLNDRNTFVLMYNAGFHSSAVQTFIPADKGFYNKSYEFSSVFSAKNPIVEEKEFYNFKKTPKLWDKAEPITRQFFNENPRVPMYEIIKKYYSDIITDDIMDTIVNRATSARLAYSAMKRKEK